MTEHSLVTTIHDEAIEAPLLESCAIEIADQISHPRVVRFARFVSNILSPAVVSVPLIILVAFYHASSVASALYYALITLIFLSIGPFGYILIGVKLGKFTDIDVSKRSQRLGPFIFGLLSMFAGWGILTLMDAPSALLTTLAATAFSGAILMVITLYWKISLHASSL